VGNVATAEREMILYTSDWRGIAPAVNLMRQLASWSLDRRSLLLADEQRTCHRAVRVWSWLACGWSRGIPGFAERYASTGVVQLWTLWSAKWLVLARLVEMRVSVLMLDSDMVLTADPYPLLHSEALARFHLLIPPEGARVNVGWLYARGATATGGLHSLLWDMVRRLRLFISQITLRDRRGAPSVEGLWDQGLFTDALTSAVRGVHSYAFTWQHSPHAFEGGALHWPPPGFTPRNASALLGKLWRRSPEMSASRPAELMPRLAVRHVQRRPWLSPQPLLWNELRTLSPIEALSPSVVAQRPDLLPGWVVPPTAEQWRTGELGGSGSAAAASHVPARQAGDRHVPPQADLVGGAPDWLICWTGHWMVTAGWLAATPPPCAALHLVECRSQFAHFSALDTLKANRPYVLRAYDHWHAEADAHAEPSAHVDTAALGSATEVGTAAASRGAAVAYSPPSRLIRLGADVLRASGASDGVGALLNALHVLAVTAALSNRTPVVPEVPCGSRWMRRHEWTIAGIADEAVLQLHHPRTPPAPASAEGAEHVSCHLALGGARCDLPSVMPAWQPLTAGDRQPVMHAMLAAETWAAETGRAGGGLGSPATDARALFNLSAAREATRVHEGAQMLEVRLAALTHWGSVDALDGHAEAAPPAVRAFHCGAPLAFGDEARLLPEERHRLSALRSACPAFFAERGKKRGQLDWLHRRRAIRSTHAACSTSGAAM
jgi:hypothetical protein